MADIRELIFDDEDGLVEAKGRNGYFKVARLDLWSRTDEGLRLEAFAAKSGKTPPLVLEFHAPAGLRKLADALLTAAETLEQQEGSPAERALEPFMPTNATKTQARTLAQGWWVEPVPGAVVHTPLATMHTTTTTILPEARVNELAQAILPSADIASFLALPYYDKLIGVAVLAHRGGDVGVRDAALATLKVTSNA